MDTGQRNLCTAFIPSLIFEKLYCIKIRDLLIISPRFEIYEHKKLEINHFPF